MKCKKFIALAVAVAMGSVIFTGCSVKLPTSVSEVTDKMTDTDGLSVENETLVDGTFTMHCRWYDQQSNPLADAEVTISQDGEELFSGTTDENGFITCDQLPANETLELSIDGTDSAAQGKESISFNLSGDFEDLSVVPSHDDSATATEIQIPTDYVEFSAAFFVQDGGIVPANLSPYIEGTDEKIAERRAEDSASGSADASEAAEESSAAAE